MYLVSKKHVVILANVPMGRGACAMLSFICLNSFSHISPHNQYIYFTIISVFIPLFYFFCHCVRLFLLSVSRGYCASFISFVCFPWLLCIVYFFCLFPVATVHRLFLLSVSRGYCASFISFVCFPWLLCIVYFFCLFPVATVHRLFLLSVSRGYCASFISFVCFPWLLCIVYFFCLFPVATVHRCTLLRTICIIVKP